MTQWLIDTFVWTGALIAMVLVLRRPVGRQFGPQVAYALWALPLLRLVLPPLVLPASMAPEGGVPVAATAVEAAAMPMAFAPAQAAPAAAFDWTLPVAAMWLVGAMVFLGWRLQQYRIMRADLLAAARPVGQVGRVRLVETPAVTAPVAFGVRDKVVALPLHFMAQHDRAARDLAIAHELAHHRGHDLLANILAQPLLALHWFNPLAWAGWRAMRRDQEAACDARVMAGCDRAEKITYARVIAGFATGRHLALAAPMACPMAGSLLGEKSIIHRLRSLTMADVSADRRKLGLAAIAGTALLALPLTASISYAQPEAPAAPAVPPAPAPNSGQPEAADPLVRRVIVVRHGDEETVTAEGMDEDEIAEAAVGARQAAAEARAEASQAARDASRAAREADQAARQAAQASASLPQIAADCGGQQQVREEVDADGRRRVTTICLREVRAGARSAALQGLREAQDAIRDDENLTPQQRQRVIDRLQERIEAMEEARVSALAPIAPVPPQLPQALEGVVAAPMPVVLWLPGEVLIIRTVIS